MRGWRCWWHARSPRPPAPARGESPALTAFAADPVIEWACSDDALPRIPAAPALPAAPARELAPPLHPAIGEVRTVDAAGAVTSVRVRPTGAVVIAADVDAPAGAVLAEIAAVPSPRYVALGSSAGPAPVEPEVAALLAKPGVPPACPALADWLERADEPCAARARAMAPLLAACPTGRSGLLAVLLEEVGVGLEGTPVVLVVARDPTDPVDPAARWGDAWKQAAQLHSPVTFFTAPRAVVAPHDGELNLVRQVPPAYPKAAKRRKLADQRCLAVVSIGKDGVPYAVEPDDACPEVFRRALVDALLQWRWQPPNVDGVSVKGQTTIGVTFRREAP